MSNTSPLFDITLHYLAAVGAVVLLGLLGGKLARKFRLPKVTGYLITGLVIGPSVLNLMSEEIVSSLSLVNDLALGLIMFAIGGVFEFHHIRSVGKKILWLTLGQSLGAFALILAGLLMVGLNWHQALLLAVIGIEIGPATTLLVIREFNSKGEFTDALISVVAASSIVCLLGFQLVFSLGELDRGASLVYVLLSPLYQLGGSLIVGGLIGYLLSKWEQYAQDQAEMLLIILGGIMLTSGVALTLNLQPLLANLIMGAVTTNLSMMHRLTYVELRQVEQPLYIAFFVIAGASLHLELLPALGLAGLVYLLTRAGGKIIGAYLVSRRLNLGPNFKKYFGLGTFVHAGVAIGLTNIISRSDQELANVIAPIILTTVTIYETVGPPVIRYVLLKIGEAEVSS